MRMLKPALVHFVVFGADFMFGPARVLLVVRRLGIRTAELLETPLMLIVVIAAARWINGRFAEGAQPPARLAIGAIALALLLVAEVARAVGLSGVSPENHHLGASPGRHSQMLPLPEGC